MAQEDDSQEPASKPVHSLVIDAGPIIRNEPSISTLLSHTSALFTTPSVLAEIRDADARSRFETTWKPFVTVRDPKPTSIKAVGDFARKTGDFAVLSKTDLALLALTFELEVERNGGDWRLRSTPGQKNLNGVAPLKNAKVEEGEVKRETTPSQIKDGNELHSLSSNVPDSTVQDESSTETITTALDAVEISPTLHQEHNGAESTTNGTTEEPPASDTKSAQMFSEPQLSSDTNLSADEASDSDGWITPSNLRTKQAQDASAQPATADKQETTLQAALTTIDFAMQNVCLRMNMNLLASNLQRIRNLKTHVLRCHACFAICRDMSKQFCPRCGGPTLTRVSCSTNSAGEFKLHLKKNMQWNNRGNRFSVPKPVAGTASGKVTAGGGKGGWGQGLILAEDQREYVKAMTEEKRRKDRDLMDQDTLPSILSGDRGSRAGGRPRVGAGRNVNSKKR